MTVPIFYFSLQTPTPLYAAISVTVGFQLFNLETFLSSGRTWVPLFFLHTEQSFHSFFFFIGLLFFLQPLETCLQSSACPLVRVFGVWLTFRKSGGVFLPMFVYGVTQFVFLKFFFSFFCVSFLFCLLSPLRLTFLPVCFFFFLGGLGLLGRSIFLSFPWSFPFTLLVFRVL